MKSEDKDFDINEFPISQLGLIGVMIKSMERPLLSSRLSEAHGEISPRWSR